MRTECSAERFGFREAAGRVVVAGFDGEAITSAAGALLLGAIDRTIPTDRTLCRALHRPSAAGAGRA